MSQQFRSLVSYKLDSLPVKMIQFVICMVLDLEFLSKPEIMWRFINTGRGGGNKVTRKNKDPTEISTIRLV